MQLHRTTKRLIVCAAIYAGLAVAMVSPVRAAKIALGYIDFIDLEMFVETDGGDWCRPVPSVRIVTSKVGTFASRAPLQDSLGKLGRLLRDKCPQMQAISVYGFVRGQTEATYTGLFEAGTGWAYADLDPRRVAALEASADQRQFAGTRRYSSDPLTVAEVRLLQQALNTLGYNAGRVDGRAGRQTGRAFSRFLTDNGFVPETTPARQGLALVAETAGLDYTPPGAAGYDAAKARSGEISVFAGPAPQGRTDPADRADRVGSAFNPDDFDPFHMDETLRSGGSHSPDLLRMVVAQNPDLLTDDAVDRIMTAEGRSFDTKYSRESERVQFRQAYLARPARETIRLAVTYSASMSRGGYNKNGGMFPVTYSFRELSSLRYPGLSLPEIGRDIFIALPDLPDITGIPMAVGAAERLERTKFRGAYDDSISLQITVYVELANLRFDASRNRMEADATLFGVSAEEEEYSARKTETEPFRYTWGVVPPNRFYTAENPVADAVAFADVMGGLTVIRNHIAIAPKSNWGSLTAALLMSRLPNVLDQDGAAISLAQALLTEAEQQDLWGGRPPSDLDRANEFDLKDAADKIREKYGDVLHSRTVYAPFKAVEIRDVDLGDYDFGQSAFSMDYYAYKDVSFFLSLDYPAIPQADLGSTFLPERLPLPEMQARQLDGILRFKGSRKVYLGIFSDVTTAAAEPTQHDTMKVYRDGRYYNLNLALSVTRIALFADPDLKNLIYDFYSEDRDNLRELQVSQRSVLELYRLRPVRFEQLAVIADRLLDDPEYVPALIKTSDDYRRANEIERLDIEARLQRQLAETHEPPELWFWGKIKLGEYSVEKQEFSVERLSLDHRRASIASFNGRFQSEDVNETDVSVPMPIDKAKALLADIRSREFQVRVRATPVSATWESDTSDEPVVAFAYHLDEVHILRGDGDTPDREKAVIARLDFEPFKGFGGASMPAPTANTGQGRPLFTQELAILLALKQSPVALSDASGSWLLASQWLRDQGSSNGLAPSRYPFFRKGARAPSRATLGQLQRQYANWIRQLPLTMPGTVRIRFSPPYLPQPLVTDTACHNVFHNPEDRSYEDSIEEFGPSAAEEDQLSRWRRQQAERVRAVSRERTGAPPAVDERPILTFRAGAAADCRFLSLEDGLEELLEAAKGKRPTISVDVDSLPSNILFSQQDGFGRRKFVTGYIDVRLSGMNVIANGNEIPSVRFQASFERAGFDVFVEEASGEISQTVQAGEITRDGLEKAANAAPEKQQRDVIGLTLGMTEQEADKLLRQHFGDPVILRSYIDRSPEIPPFSDAVMYHRRDKQERVSLYFEAGSGDRRILAIERIVRAPNWGLSREDVSTSATAKYGKPEQASYDDSVTVLYWGDNLSNNYCTSVTQERIDYWVDSKNNRHAVWEYFDWAQARDSGIGYSPGLYSSEMISNPENPYKNCGELLSLKHTSQSLSLFLVNLKEYTHALRQTRVQIKKQFEGEAASKEKPKIKL
ncbi:hypothetical protein GGD81_001136 [Rhodobium orientis]|nr:peptidoglycan-binding protein [Rhodobium orientis]MBB4302112.1 hypothetical protein [Rhodobium orientis]